MLSTDADGLHGDFLTCDGFGQRLFAVTASGLTIVHLANVPLGIGSLAPTSGAASGGVSATIRGSGFQSPTNATVGGKQASVTLTDMSTISIVTPALSAGPQRLVLSNPSGESVAFDAAFFAKISPNHSPAGFILVCENP
jgi:IPT/TIG domain